MLGWGMIRNNHHTCDERDSRHVRMRREGAAGVSSREGLSPNVTREQSSEPASASVGWNGSLRYREMSAWQIVPIEQP